MNALGGDAKQQNMPAEIYARIRADTIEECAKVAASWRVSVREQDVGTNYYQGRIDAAKEILALKVQA